MAHQPQGLLASPFVQMAYVTNDFDAALAVFADRHGIREFLELRGFVLETRPGGNAVIDIGLAWAGGIQIELIHPISGADSAYRDILRGGDEFELHFHHEAQRVTSLEALASLKAQAQEQGFPIVIDGCDQAGTTYFYADCRKTIGHLVEYIYFPPTTWERVASAIPRNG